MTPSPATPGATPERPLAPEAARDLASLLDAVAEEGRRETDAILAEARAGAQERLRAAEQTAVEIETEAAARGAEEGEREARRRVSLAHIEAAKALLGHREQLVDRAIARARDRFTAWLDGAEGRAWLARGIVAAAQALAVDRVRARVPPAAREPLAAALEADALAVEWEERDDAEPGVLLSTPDGRRRVDLTVPGILRRRADAARRAAASALFEETQR
jgi:vacuolar-type H+-ATPase subunit E/Vma4